MINVKMYDHTTTRINHTMLRITDPAKSLAFYALFGFSLLEKTSIPEGVDAYYLAFDSDQSTSPGARWTNRQGVLELQHHTQSNDLDASTRIESGNTTPKGYGHVCVSVDNVQAACSRLEDLGVPFQKKLRDGRMHFLAFASDPDGYWVEIIARKPLHETEGVEETDMRRYRVAHTMLRIKDPRKSLDFYSGVLGMEVLRESQHEAAGFGVYFLGYPRHSEHYIPKLVPEGAPGIARPVYMEGLLELTWNYGTEKEEGRSYWNGNEDWMGERVRGFGHVGISVGDVGRACEVFEGMGVEWVRKLGGDGKGAAVMKDPDGYEIEILQNQEVLV